MKNIIKSILTLLLAMNLFSCDYLDYNEKTDLTKEDIFSDFSRSKAFLTDIYNCLPSDFCSIGDAMRSSATDEAEHIYSTSTIHRFTDGSWSAFNTIDAKWETFYSGIRAANQFVVETEGQTFEEEKYNDDYEEMMIQFNNYAYEARFLRAFFYFELAKRYGDIPLFTNVLTEEEANQVSKSTFEEVISFIVEECDAVALELPNDYTAMPNEELGRVTKGAALALKAKALLYAASPLFNESNDIQRWEDAALAASNLILSDQYILEADYLDIVNNHTSTELILARRLGNSNGFEQKNFPIGYEGGNTSTCPTQNLVDAYEMKATGLPITDSASGYNQFSPYEGRDSRMAATILYHGAMWKGQLINVIYGGANAKPLDNATTTGYYLKKYVIEGVELDPTNTTSKQHTWVLFRLGEVYLNLAEAMNEAYGPDQDPDGLGMTATQAVNVIRTRAGIEEFPIGMSQDEFRTKLQNERRVELAFEDHRFWDVRRWKIGSETTSIYGVEITEDQFGIRNYEQILVNERVFEDKMNLYPIPQSEIYINSNLKPQNQGW